MVNISEQPAPNPAAAIPPSPMQELGKLLLLLGLILAGAGIYLWKLADKLPLGRLPGDIVIQKPGFSFYFPLGTCLLLSLLVSGLLWLLRR